MGTAFDISKTALKELARRKGVKKITRMTSKELRELQSTQPTPNNNISFSFIYDIRKIDNGCIVTLTGKHYSKNRHNSFTRKNAIRYATAIKKAATDYWLQHREEIKELKAKCVQKTGEYKAIAYILSLSDEK